MDRSELADFLRTRREQLKPADVGLPARSRRRTPGLSREELGALAGMSADYISRLEQARGPNPSLPILTSLARALRLTDDERDHLLLLAGQAAPASRRSVGSHIGPALLNILDRLVDVPAFICTDVEGMLVQNRLSIALSGDWLTRPPEQRNYVRAWFLDPAVRALCPPADVARHSFDHVADLRVTYARRQGDPDVEALVSSLQAASPEFAALWAQHPVAVRRSTTKRFDHPELGLLHFVCEPMISSSTDQRLIALFPEPGTDCAEKLDLLRVIGTQPLSPTP